MVLTVIGRKSGRPRSTPVTPMYAGFPAADWVRNARTTPEALD